MFLVVNLQFNLIFNLIDKDLREEDPNQLKKRREQAVSSN